MPTDEELLYTGKRFQVKRATRTRPDGSILQKEVIRHPGSVVIVPIVDTDHVCLIRNFRMAAGRTLIELPAGTLESQEPPLTCAMRELIEETGYRAAVMEELTAFYAAPGMFDEYMHLFVAKDLTPGDAAREPDEEIENLVVPLAEALQMIQRGDICDAKTMIGLLLYYQNYVLPGLR
ncbi:MAG: NUDIX hydrolase [Planctomycetales bacterium]|nr:NUDIX hydrolase [Planctomycetales bacterium]MCA9169640.1 NUDIX hydrolase [Planctomycetales bacterium]